MRIISDKQQATWMLVPGNNDEKRAVAAVIGAIAPGEQFLYGGVTTHSKTGFTIVKLNAGGHLEDVPLEGGGVHHGVPVDGQDLFLLGDQQADDDGIFDIRAHCFYTGEPPIFLGTADVDGTKALVLTGGKCRDCGKQIFLLAECVNGICMACKTKCPHPQFSSGLVIRNGTPRPEQCCTRCGISEKNLHGAAA